MIREGHDADESNDRDEDMLLADYERIERADLPRTIDEVLRRAARRGGKAGEYAISVPIVVASDECGEGRTTTTSVSVPLLLDPCPPTITSVSTFGSFRESRVFERTPVVVSARALNATEVRAAWFVDGREVRLERDASRGAAASAAAADDDECTRCLACYTPTADDVGKVLSLVLVPVRDEAAGSA